jgi:hypothetical protein
MQPSIIARGTHGLSQMAVALVSLCKCLCLSVWVASPGKSCLHAINPPPGEAKERCRRRAVTGNGAQA